MPWSRTPIAMIEVADGAILLDETTGTFYHVNPTGALAYRLLRTGGFTIAETARTLASTFGTDEASTRSDVEAFAGDLASSQLVTR